jgi:hypothetical protein
MGNKIARGHAVPADIELLTTRQLLALPPPTWLMEGLLPTDALIGLSGKSGDGKSFIALDWSMHISQGLPWMGHAVARAPVIYVAAEGGRGIQKRVRAWMRAHDMTELLGMYFIVSPLYVREEGTIEAFCDALGHADHERINPGLVVIDTLARSFGGGEENSSADMGAFMARLTELSAERRVSVLVVHHLNATGTKERGHTSFKAGLDAGFLCTSEKNSDGRIIRLTLQNNKQKDDVEAPAIYLQPSEASGASLVFEEAPPPEQKKRAEGPKSRKVDILTILECHPEGMTFREVLLVAGIAKSSCWRRLKRLENAGDIYLEGGKYFAMASTVDLADMEDAE